MDDTWEDDCSVSESSSNCAPHHDLQFREFNNPHFNGGYDRNNPEGSNDHSDGKRFSLPVEKSTIKNGIQYLKCIRSCYYIFTRFFMYRIP